MPEQDKSRANPHPPPGLERKAAKIAARKAELADIAPVLRTLPWRDIRAGYARLRDIADFIRFYEMYAPLLAGHKEVLVKARDSGEYEFFDLRASAGGIVVTGIDRRGKRTRLFEIKKDYWEGEYSPVPPLFTPL